MKIIINTTDNHHFEFPIPLSIIKNSLAQDILFYTIKKNTDTDLSSYKSFINQICKYLEDYVKENNKFVFIEVQSADGTHVTIEV